VRQASAVAPLVLLVVVVGLAMRSGWRRRGARQLAELGRLVAAVERLAHAGSAR
jgi:hypothetical protein